MKRYRVEYHAPTNTWFLMVKRDGRDWERLSKAPAEVVRTMSRHCDMYYPGTDIESDADIAYGYLVGRLYDLNMF